jgi:hypothetical protein
LCDESDNNAAASSGHDTQIGGTQWAPFHFLDEFIWVLHDGMPPDVELEYLAGVRRYVELYKGFQTRATACTGCDIKEHIENSLARVWRNRYGVEMQFKQVLKCEIKEDKQAFLLNHFKDFILTRDMKDIAMDSVFDIATQQSVVVPYFVNLCAGFPCISRTPISSNMKANANCVQEGRSETGLAAQYIFNIIDKHIPDEITLENIKQLDQLTPGSLVSDAEWIRLKLEEKLNWSIYFLMENEDYGGFLPRSRLWWVALRHLRGNKDEISQFFLKILNSLKLPRDTFTLASIFTTDPALRRAEANACGQPSVSACGLREPKRAGKSEPDYKLEHFGIFNDFGLPWPLDIGVFSNTINFSGMFRREQEATVFLNSVFPMPKDVQIQFIDVNPTLSRLCNGCFHEDAETARLSIKKSPWQDAPPTLVGSMKLVLRERVPDSTSTSSSSSSAQKTTIRVRIAEGFEYMRCIGWDDSMFKNYNFNAAAAAPYDIGPSELLSNLAGNAWSCFHYAPVLMAEIATAGKYLAADRDAVDDRDAADTVEVDSAGSYSDGGTE